MNTDLETLCQQALTAPDYWVRRQAARQLGKHQAPAARETLLRILEREVLGEVIQGAILSLVKHGAREMLPYITKPKIMMSPDEPVRWACAHALGVMGSAHNFEHLYAFVNDPDWSVRAETISTLKILISRIGESGDEGCSLEETLLLLIRMLAIDNSGLQECIIQRLVAFGHSQLEFHLVEALDTENELIRIGLVKTLGRLGSMSALSHLVPLLHDQSLLLRLAAVEALGLIGGLSAVNALISQLNDSNETLVKAAIQGILRHQGQESVRAVLAEALRSDTQTHRKKNILFIMGEIGSAEFIPDILRNLGSSYFLIRMSAAAAMVKYGDSVLMQVAEILRLNEPPPESLFREAQAGATTAIRVNAIRALGALRHPASFKVVEELNQAEDRQVALAAMEAYQRITESIWARTNAAYILGKLGGGSALETLQDGLRDESFRVRWAVVIALRRLRSEKSVSLLVNVLETEVYPEIRREAVVALAEIGDVSKPVIDVLLKMLGDPSYRVRLEAARAIGKIPDDRCVKALFSAIGDKSFEVRQNVVNALFTMGRSVLPELQRLLQTTSDRFIRKSIMKLYGMFFYREGIPHIEEILINETDEEILMYGDLILGILYGSPDDNRVLFR